MLSTLSEDDFIKPEEWSAAHPLSSSSLSETDDERITVKKPRPSVPETPSTMSDSDYKLVGAGQHVPPNTGSSTEAGHESTEADASLVNQVFPIWFHPDNPDHGLTASYVSPPNLEPSSPGPSKASDSDHRLVMVEPPLRSPLPSDFDTDRKYRVAHPPPPLPGSSSPGSSSLGSPSFGTSSPGTSSPGTSSPGSSSPEYDPYHWKAYEDMPDRRSMGAASNKKF
jgi:hypothetical protein